MQHAYWLTQANRYGGLGLSKVSSVINILVISCQRKNLRSSKIRPNNSTPSET